MKKFGILFFLLALMVGLGTIGPVQADDITIFDYQYHRDFNPNPPGSVVPPNSLDYKQTPAKEDQSVTHGAVTGQQWDMEAAIRWTDSSTPADPKNNLALVGGWNWQNGLSGYKTGDLFIDVDLDSRYGHFITATSGTILPNSNFRYDYAIRFNNSTAKWEVMALTSTTNLTMLSGGPPEAMSYSRPWKVADEWTGTPGGNLQYSTVNTDKITLDSDYYFYSNGTNTPGTYDGTDPHYIANIEGFLDWLTTEGYDLDLWRGHITMECGNDNLIMQPGGPTGVVPLPGAVLLLGAGLVRLASYYRRQR